MFIAFAIVLAFVFVAATFITFVVLVNDRPGKENGMPSTFLGLISMTMVMWIVAAGLQPWKLEKEKTYPVTQVGNVQCVSYTDLNGSEVLANLTAKTQKIYPLNSQIVVKLYSPGPYWGIYFAVNYVEFESPDYSEFIKGESK